MRRGLITWGVVFALALAVGTITVTALNATLYSASGFVQSYLDALARHDADGALELAGDSAQGDASRELLTSAAMGELTDIALVSEATDGPLHQVTFSFRAGGAARTSTFDVVRTASFLGVFDRWAFTTSPLELVRLTVYHDARFRVNDLDLVSPTPGEPAPYLVFAPGSYTFEHRSPWLTSEPTTVTADRPGEIVTAHVDVTANAEFIAQVQDKLNAYLDECATQQVLLPAGCPFGQTIRDRITSTPQWSMRSYPLVTISPTNTTGEWTVAQTEAVAHLVVDVKSLFDGTISTLDTDVPFALGATITLTNDQILITPTSP